MESPKPRGRDPKTGRPYKDMSGWKAVVMDPQSGMLRGSHLLMVERPIGNQTVVKAGDSFEPNLPIYMRYIRATQSLKTAKAQLNSIMRRVRDALPKTKKRGWKSAALGDERIVEMLQKHGIEDVLGFGSSANDVEGDGGFNPGFDGHCSDLDGYGSDSQPEEEEEKAGPVSGLEGWEVSPALQ